MPSPRLQLEVEHVEVLAHPLGPHGLRDDDDPALDQPAQDDLSDRLPVRPTDLGEGRVREQVVAPLRERPPRLDSNAALTQQLLIVGALEEGMRLDLVDRRRDLVVLTQIDEPVGIEVRDTDGACEPLLVQLLHRPPRAVVVAERLVDQIQVEVVNPELLKRSLERTSRLLLALMLNPELRRDEQLLARDAARLDPATDGFLVAVRRSRVERLVPGGNRLDDHLLRVLGWNLEDAEAEDRHLDAVVQGDGRNGLHRCPFASVRPRGSACEAANCRQVEVESGRGLRPVGRSLPPSFPTVAPTHRP